MIFVAVGTQAPFDRLIEAMDRWASVHSERRVLAQVGNSRAATRAIDTRRWMGTREFEDAMRNAELVITHAGMGTILNALRLEVPLLIMPRQARLGEHRDDHQQSTARRLEELGVVPVAWSESELDGQIELLLQGAFHRTRTVSTRDALVAAVRRSVLEALKKD